MKNSFSIFENFLYKIDNFNYALIKLVENLENLSKLLYFILLCEIVTFCKASPSMILYGVNVSYYTHSCPLQKGVVIFAYNGSEKETEREREKERERVRDIDREIEIEGFRSKIDLKRKCAIKQKKHRKCILKREGSKRIKKKDKKGKLQYRQTKRQWIDRQRERQKQRQRQKDSKRERE